MGPVSVGNQELPGYSLTRLLTIQTTTLMNWDPLKTLKSNFGSTTMSEDGLGERCSGEWDNWVSEIRQKLFESLPDFFLDL